MIEVGRKLRWINNKSLKKKGELIMERKIWYNSTTSSNSLAEGKGLPMDGDS